MHISQIKISNILGITDLEFSAGQFNEIAGPNGTGKTSVLEAIKAVVSGGHDATLLRQGADKGEIVLVLDDQTEIRKRVGGRSSPVDVIQDGKKVARPAEAVKSLVDALSANPVEFLTARKQDRVKVLLEAMPITVDADKLTEISGIPVVADDSVHGLQVIEAVRKQVFDDRTGTNRAVKEKDATINQLRHAIPEAPGGVVGSEDDLRAALDEANQARDAELERIRSKLDGIKTANLAKIDDIKREAQAAIDAIREDEADIERKAHAQRERTLAKHSETAQPITESINAIVADRKNAAKREQALETIEKLEEELEALQADAATQTKALADIDAYKSELLASLPIPGVEVVDGEVFRDGVPFDRLNTAQQVDIAVEIAKLRAGELAVCCVDGLELLDSAAFDQFKERATESGLQLFVTRVNDETFQVNTQ